MDTKNKKTVLDDEASIYQRKEEVSEKEKWKSMSWKKRWEYFKSYYLLKIIVSVIAIALVGSLVYNFFAPKAETILSVAVIDRALDTEMCLELKQAFEEAVEIDPETQQMMIDSGFDFQGDAYNSLTRFVTYSMAGTLDVAIMPQSVFEEYTPSGYFWTITEYLPTDLYMRLSDYLVECQWVDEEEGSETVYAVKLDSTWLYEGKQLQEPMVLGIISSVKNEESIVDLVRLLFFPEEVK